MTPAPTTMPPSVEDRARLSGGTSEDAIYRMVAAALTSRHPSGGALLDVGCGRGRLWHYLAEQFRAYHGADVVRYDGFPDNAEFHRVDFDTGRIPVEDGFADVVAAVETIEHLENPRAFVRELVRVTKPGGWVAITTPNNLSLLSKLTLVVKNQFNAFQAGSYPAHISALLEIDLRRIAAECGLIEIDVAFTKSGRIPGTSWPFPRLASRLFPRLLSDNILLISRRPKPGF